MSRRGVAKPTSSLPGSGLGLQCRGTPPPHLGAVGARTAGKALWRGVREQALRDE